MTSPNSSPRRLAWSAQTHQGRVRRNNEDAFLGLRFDRRELTYLGKEGEAVINEHEFIFAVSDGMGGENAGEFASKVVLQTVINLVSREFHQKTQEEHLKPGKLLYDFCQRIHEHARDVSRYYEECRGMGATLSLCWLQKGLAHIAHLGDSRIYYLPQDGQIQQLTDDHTVTGRLVREGCLSEQEARRHPRRHQLERSIGCHPDPVQPQIIATPFIPGDHFLICTDGITDGVWNHGIEKFIHHPPPYLVGLPPAQRLVKEALEASGRDNLTALVLKVQ
ncbi:MAG: putative protein phosphatase 2C-type [Verrucomicrobia subdivision 3 bacterium]|nr:putative protein phosphatase 2C-type [Limisphaerales bacterium]MCS1412475.1 putative protein phosphatase 2C-type [Limisphaerales bacterium]